MTIRLRTPMLLGLFGLVGVLLAGPVQAQLKLPKKGSGERPATKSARPRQGGTVAPHLVCSICFERNYTSPRTGGTDGFQQAFCGVCKRSTLHRDPNKGRGKVELALPGRATSTSDGPEKRAAGAASAGLDGMGVTDSGRAAAYVFDEVGRVETIQDPLVAQGVDQLINLGEPGRIAARLQIANDHAPSMMTAAQVLLLTGQSHDMEAVVRRVQGRVPREATAALVDAIVAADPVRATPEFLCGLLDHRQSGIRTAAERHLRKRLDPALVADLEQVLESRRSDTRLRAVDLLSRIDDEASIDVLLAHVADPTAKVAGAIVEALARSDDERIDQELIGLAFRENWVLRSEAYALLAIVEREDARLEPLLDASHVDPLLAAISSSDPFVSGTAACALAGIGFRSPRPSATAWLDDEVPERLIYVVSGSEFHNDYSALARPALRRLRRITGEPISDGPGWVDWWVAARDEFYARRAWIEMTPEDASRLVVHYEVAGARPDLFTLLGPALAAERSALRLGETVRLVPPEVADLVRVLERENVFGPDRLPGLRGSQGQAERTLEVLVDGRGKKFQFAAGASEPWFERVVGMAASLRERNRWQRYPVVRGDAAVAADSVDPVQFWQQESPWWAEEHELLERDLRLKELVLDWLPAQRVAQREPGLRQVVELYRRPGVPSAADFGTFVELLAEERFLAERARQLVDLALVAGTADVHAALPGVPSDDLAEADAVARATAVQFAPALARALARDAGALLTGTCGRSTVLAFQTFETPASEAAVILPRPRAEELVQLLHDRFGPPASKELTLVYAAAGRDFARAMAHSDRGLLRAVSTASLADDPTPADVKLLLGLLGDPDKSVEIAAVLALGEEHVEAARTELLLRARVGRPAVRKAALRSVGKLGGSYVFDALLLAFADDDPEVRTAAIRGMADLGDERAAPYLIRMLGEDPDSEAYQAAHEGLARLGDAARTQLLRVVHSVGHPGRRAAALLLAYQRAPEAAPTLISLLTREPDDDRLAFELCVLTCVDLRDSQDPPQAWWDWWDSVVHGDSLAWFRAALERLELDPPPPEAFRSEGTMETALFLVDTVDGGELWLVERARRELEALLGRTIRPIPPPGPERDEWLTIARNWIDQSLGE